VLPRLVVRAGGRPIPDYPGVGRIYSYPVPAATENGAAAVMEAAPEPQEEIAAGE